MDFVAVALAGIKSNHGQVARAAERFGLSAVAGKLAMEFGLVAWPEDQPAKDALALFKVWLAMRGGDQPAEIRQMIEQAQRFMEAHGDARFDDLDPPPNNPFTGKEVERRPVSNRAGFRRGKDDARRWLVLPQAWREELCAGFDAREVARTLAGFGMLELGEGAHQAQNIRIFGATQRFTCLRQQSSKGVENVTLSLPFSYPAGQNALGTVRTWEYAIETIGYTER